MSHMDPYLFPFKATHEHQLNAVGTEALNAETSPRTVLDTLLEDLPLDQAQPVDAVESRPEEYHAGSSGVNRALGRETAVYKGSRRHPEWPPEVWKTLPQHERRRLSEEFLQNIQNRLDKDGASDDYWHLDGDVLERVHRSIRKNLFDPSSVADIPVDIRLLHDSRPTIMFFDDESFARRDDETWRQKGIARQPTKH